MSRIVGNRILSPPSFIAPTWEEATRLEKALLDTASNRICGPLEERLLGAGLEVFVRQLVSNCAGQISIPRPVGGFWRYRNRQKALTRESKRFVSFLDTRNSTLKAVSALFRPVIDEVSSQTSTLGTAWYWGELATLQYQFYLLVEATRARCEVEIDPKDAIGIADRVCSDTDLSSRSKMILARVRGIFSLFTETESLDGFRCNGGGGMWFADRVDEVLEDAYLMEASILRRQVVLGASKALARRSLRRIVRYIANKRSWAKRSVRAASVLATITMSPQTLADGIAELLPEIASSNGSPVLIKPDLSLLGTTGCLVHFSAMDTNHRQPLLGTRIIPLAKVKERVLYDWEV